MFCMANEAVMIYADGLPIPFTCSNTVGIERGTILTLSDPMTAAACNAVNDIVAGIAATEKIANDGKTKIGVYRSGIFKMTLSGSCSVGDPLGTDIQNLVQSQRNTLNLSGSKTVGTALETGTNGETILVQLTCSQTKTSTS